MTLATEETEEEDKPRSPKWRRVRRITGWTLGALIGGPLIAFWIAYLVLDVRSPQEVLAGLDKTVVLKYADGSELLKVIPADGDRMFVPYSRVPAKLRDAIIATEDPTFWDNQGFDPTGIGRAFLTGVGGGSGITQQYIKKSTGDEDATLGRKFAELVLATKITQEQGKEQIFESYVNIISFGRGTFGPAAAMNAYFGKKLDDSITWSEAAFLAGMIQSPSVHDPAASGDLHAARRWQYVRDKLVSRGYVKDGEPMAYPGPEIQPPSETRAGRVTYDEFHVKQQVLAELERDGFPLGRLQQGNMTVETTLDRSRQDAAKKALRDRLNGEPKEFRGAVVAIDPATGAVRAYYGGDQGVRDYAGTPHALGTAFHPFTLAAALGRGYVPDQPIPSPSKLEFLGENFQYPDVCGPKCTLRSAMETHADGPFIELAKRLGPEALSDAARRAGIPDAVDGVPTLREKDGFLIGAGIAIGRYPLRPLDVAGAYGTFAAGGRRATPHLVERVRDENGAVVWENPDTARPAFGDDDTSRRVAEEVTSTLRTDGPAALRTGEAEHGNSPDYQDAWAVGYTPQLATAVWIGSDDDRRLKDASGRKLTGDTVPADVWRAFTATAARPPR
ncbi:MULTISPECIES: transglycosylase domain-containing protein [unclassified Amycolatopsis]|uniref:transglycosylase domain-containing protein n=1 Tax=unclassified Amycolatopsis TaxID=2618356 RepID=UPI0028742A48|nr:MULTISPECIES: transglycosylase domain-containing protein [unclassified Amycolatopsis]MDS0138086.1 penicillin-binding protein [Amycolatopsis sp. 505]MDS0144001.1 penicillin-binding protein [Amycolatopsis sp. CM201R]